MFMITTVQQGAPPRRTPRLILTALAAATIAAAVTSPATAAPTAAQPAATSSAGAVVKTDHGTVEGITTGRGRKFLGIPYAAQPGRWQDPKPAQPWTARPAKQQHAPCPQPAFEIGDDTNTYLDEDCLYLNIYTPPGANKNLPVMFFIPGGGAANGNAAPYDGSMLARKGNMIVVTANTRVGALGFLADSALSSEGGDPGNYGAKDATFALHWVRDNISAFGGDRSRVTYSGFSSTTLLGCDLLASPAAAGLFSRAIQMSGPCGFASRPLSTGQATGRSFAEKLGCDDAADILACLRKEPVAALLFAQDGLSFNPVHGTRFLPSAPVDAIAAGKYNRVPVMVTTDLDELRVFLAIGLNSLAAGSTAKQTDAVLAEATPNEQTRRGVDLVLERAVTTRPKAERDRLFRAYRQDRDRVLDRLSNMQKRGYQSGTAAKLTDYATESADPLLFLAKAASDYGISCTARGDARAFSSYAPIYQAEFADRDLPNIFNVDFPFPHGAYHTIEQGLLWNLQFGEGPFTLTPAQQRERDTVIGYIAHFVATGNPNGQGLPSWNRFTAGSPKNLWIDDAGVFMRSDYEAGHNCALWSQLPAPWQVV